VELNTKLHHQSCLFERPGNGLAGHGNAEFPHKSAESRVIFAALQNVRLWHKADMPSGGTDVRFRV